jgi:lipid-binding SYLF domain-containing protein
MTSMRKALFAGLICSLVLSSTQAQAQTREDNTVRQASGVFDEIMRVRLSGIPQGTLANAHGIAIIPGVIKGSFVIGARHGRGVLLVRADDGNWHAPAFVSLTGGNIGWQIGVQSTDVILVFRTKKSVDGIMNGKLTLGADAAVAAGPVGRNAAAATDAQLKAEILSYSRSRGLFAGVAFDGSVISVDNFSNAAYYRSPGPGQPVAVPEAAIGLVQQVVASSTPQTISTEPVVREQSQTTETVQAAPVSTSLATADANTDEAELVRRQLARMAPEMYEHLDDQWKAFLALPAEIFSGAGNPNLEELQQSVNRFESVRADSKYASLTQRPEFQSTYGILRHYVAVLDKQDAPLDLPPPPAK